jgi:allantoinase
MADTFYVKSQRVILPDTDAARPATVVIENGKIARVLPIGETPTGMKGSDCGNLVLMPGLVDTHVHVNEPGRTEWEGFQTATHAAAAGGITQLVDMPLNSIPATTTLAALETKRKSALNNCTIDYGLWGGVVPGNSNELEAMAKAGALGFKAFLIESGVDEFPMATEKDLRLAMPILAKVGRPLLVHAELEGPCSHNTHDTRSYNHYLESRPQEWEVNAIRMMIRLSEETGCHVHIVHLSAADALDDLRAARARGVRITAETCPHYLYFKSEEIPAGATQFKCAPPIRENENRERLWKALEDGTIDFVVSDHSPCTPALKKLEAGEFDEAWGGISGLQFGLSVVWTAMRERGLGPEKLAKWMSERTSRFLGLPNGIRPGAEANLVLWNPEESFTLAKEMVRHKHALTPYDGRRLFGVVEKTFLRGERIYDRKDPVADVRHGRQIHTAPGGNA